MKIGIRRAEPSDATILEDFVARLKSLNEELDPLFKTVENLRDEVRKYIKSSLEDDRSIVLVAYNTENGEIVGMLRLEIIDRIFYSPRTAAVITDLYVKPKHRGGKIATLLLEKAKEEAKARGAGLLVATYPANNMIAEAFYSKAGFKTLQVEKFIPL